MNVWPRQKSIIERLWKIIDWRPDYINEGIYPPKNDEIIKAANTIIKLDLAILKSEMDAGIFDRKLGTFDVNVYRNVQLAPDTAEKIAMAVQRWGVNLNLPNERPKVIEQLPVNGTAATGVGQRVSSPS
jgi:hypothetical protein